MKIKDKYKAMCYECGKYRYIEKRKDAFEGIGVSLQKCPICKKKKGVIPARDWLYRAGLIEKYI